MHFRNSDEPRIFETWVLYKCLNYFEIYLSEANIDKTNLFSVAGTGGKKGRQKERRLMKGFDIGVVKQPPNKSNHQAELEAANKSPRSHWIKLANLANGKKQVKGRWPYNERSQSVESLSSEVTSEAEATHNESTSSASSVISQAGSTAGVTVTLSDEEESVRCDRATNTDTPALKWSKIRKWSKLGELNLPHRLRMAFQDSVPEREISHPPSAIRQQQQSRAHLGDAPRKTKARRTVSAPAPSAHAKHSPLTAKSPANAPYASIPSVSVSVQNNTRTLNTLSGKLEGVEDSASAGSSNLNSPSSPKTPNMRLQESFRVPTVHIEEEVVVKGTSKKSIYGRNESSFQKKDSDITVRATSPENFSTTISLTPPNEIIAPSQTESPHKPSNGTLGIISSVYGIEPVNKEMRTGWI